MFKDIVVPMIGASGDTVALNTAIDYATGFDAQIAVLEMINLPMPGRLKE